MTASTHSRQLPEAVQQLAAAAQVSLQAPSVFNTQPWRWRVAGDVLELYAEHGRQLEATDPDGRLLLLSCGAALHHARVALAAAGWSLTVDRLPDGSRPDLLARLRLGKAVPADPEAQMMAGAMKRRRTDRRAFSDREVPAATLTRLRRLVEAEGTYLHVVRPDQIPMLAISAELAADAEGDDADYQAELAHWTSRPRWSRDGVPPETAVESGLRRVPVRDFAPETEAGLSVGAGIDKGAAYVVIFGMTDRPIDLLRGGEALSALLLKASAEGLSTAPLSDTIEVSWPRHLLRGLIADIGEPYIVVRLGYAGSSDPLPPVPRRAAADVIDVLG
jgi:nitroreductase